MKGDYIPLYMGSGANFMSASVGLYMATRELLIAPSVMLTKSKRNTDPKGSWRKEMRMESLHSEE